MIDLLAFAAIALLFAVSLLYVHGCDVLRSSRKATLDA
jgi:hypothetical protein